MYGVLVTGSYLNELSLLDVPAHAVTVLLARYGRRVFAALGWPTGVGDAVLPLAAITARENTPSPGSTAPA